MTESIQIVMMFCLTIIAIVGIVSVVILHAKDRVSFKLKARAKLPHSSQAEFGMEVIKADTSEDK